MAKTKGELATEALEDIGFDLPIDADDLSKAVKRLERMVTGWANNGVYIPYLRTAPALPTDDSGVRANDENALIQNLGVIMANVFSVILPPNYAGEARDLYTKLIPVELPTSQNDSMLPTGAGGRIYNNYLFDDYYQNPDQIIDAAIGSKVKAEIELKGGTGTILAVEWSDITGTITITDEALLGATASAFVQFSTLGQYDVKIKATYSGGEEIVSCIKYNVTECVDNDSKIIGQAPSGGGCSFIERTLALPGSSTAQDDVLTVTGTGTLTLHNSATAVKEIKIIATDGTCTFAVEAGDSVNIANVTAGNSVELTPTEFGWLVS